MKNELPFRHFVARSVFETSFHRALEQQFLERLSRGFGPPTDRDRFSKNMPNSDAFAWNFPPGITGPLALFYAKGWREMIAALVGTRVTGDVNGALHHHQVASADGQVHRDLGVGWFSSQPRLDGSNPMDLSRCSYTTGQGEPGVLRRERVRAITMIYYLSNPGWCPGDGGETGLYSDSTAAVSKPASVVPPISNSILVFENTLGSYHSFLSNRRLTRNSIILWLHRTLEDAAALFGRDSIGRWLR